MRRLRRYVEEAQARPAHGELSEHPLHLHRLQRHVRPEQRAGARVRDHIVEAAAETLPFPPPWRYAAGAHLVRHRAPEVRAGSNQARGVRRGGTQQRRRWRSAEWSRVSRCTTTLDVRLLRRHLHQPGDAAQPRGGEEARQQGADSRCAGIRRCSTCSSRSCCRPARVQQHQVEEAGCQGAGCGPAQAQEAPRRGAFCCSRRARHLAGVIHGGGAELRAGCAIEREHTVHCGRGRCVAFAMSMLLVT